MVVVIKTRVKAQRSRPKWLKYQQNIKIMTFVKGQSGNPAGKPKGTRSFTTKVREALEKIAEGKDYTYEAAFIKQILKKGIVDGDNAIIKLIWNYLDGMPVQKIAGDNDSPLIIQIAKEIAQKNDTDIGTSNNSEGQSQI